MERKILLVFHGVSREKLRSGWRRNKEEVAVSLGRAHCRHQVKFIQGLTLSRDRIPERRCQVSCRDTNEKGRALFSRLPDFWSPPAITDF